MATRRAFWPLAGQVRVWRHLTPTASCVALDDDKFAPQNGLDFSLYRLHLKWLKLPFERADCQPVGQQVNAAIGAPIGPPNSESQAVQLRKRGQSKRR